MTSQILLEGILDVKDPRGSEDRKFWKVWRRLWTNFSVVYPSGRREPFLLLTLSRNSSGASLKEIKFTRDGLRLFRCRSKTRPCRTWAIASGNKVALYFAAESETEGQNWMQAVRDGLWPPCFSFQMLAACSQEVSLIDDDNTFMSGLLGVYGRFVPTSEDVISLMHPHWGSTLLQISLSNIKDVVLVREADVPPAGVFKILLEKVEGSKVTSLQFFCNKAKEAVQFILSKLYAKYLEQNKELSESNALTSTLNKTILPKKNRQEICENQYANFQTAKSPSFILKTSDEHHEGYSASDYENLQYLKKNAALNIDRFPGINNFIMNEVNNENNTRDNVSEFFLQQQPKNKESSMSNKNTNGNAGLENNHENFKPTENIYANIAHGTDSNVLMSFGFPESKVNEYENTKLSNEKVTALTSSNNATDFEVLSTVNKYNTLDGSQYQTSAEEFSTNEKNSPKEECTNETENIKLSNEKVVSREITALTSSNNATDFEVYSTVNKYNTLDGSQHQTSAEKFSTNEKISPKEECRNETENSSSLYKLDNTKVYLHSLQANYGNGEIKSTLTRNIKMNSSSDIIHVHHDMTKVSNTDIILEGNAEFHSPHALISEINGTVNKSIPKNSNEQLKKAQPTTHVPLNDYKRIDKNNTKFLSSHPSDFLDTSTNSLRLNDGIISESISSKDDTEFLPWIVREFSVFNADDQVYEDIVDRKGTIYEKVDSSDDEYTTELIAPELPKRPEKLDIPESLRLQKLSKNITQTLKVMENEQSPTKEHYQLSLVKKIKDVNRITQLHLNLANAKEPYIVERKLPIDSQNISVLRPSSAITSLVNINTKIKHKYNIKR